MLTLGIDTRPKLQPETFLRLRDLIYARCGIFFADGKKYLLETRLARRLEERSLKTFEDYYYYLTYDAGREKEIHTLINSIVTNETSFFRDIAQLDAFKKGVVPKVMEEKARSFDKTLRVWSAACSTGEEPYTLAMMMMEEGVQARGFNIEVHGSDICDNVLRSAEAAMYDKYTLRNTPEAYKKKYFDGGPDSYSVEKRLKALVRLKKINLIDSTAMRAYRSIDVIFCRNVLIYFDDASKKKAVTHLYDSLSKGGYLFIGFSETLHNITRLFRPVSFESSVVYQKN